MTLLILIALIPFAALGIAVGHMLTPDSIGPAVGGGVGLLAFLGGTWFPIPSSGFLHDVAQILPSYWLVQASHVALGGHPWPAKAWIVIAAWTVVLGAARPAAPTGTTPGGCKPARATVPGYGPRLPRIAAR